MADYIIQGSSLDAIVEAINHKAGTQNTMTPADMVTAIRGLPSPSGSITITENGTYDVTDKATAVVALPYTYKRWVYTNQTLISDTQIVNLLTDTWLAQYYNNTALEVMVTAIIPPPADDSNSIYFSSTRARNVVFGNEDNNLYQIILRVGGSGMHYSGFAGSLNGDSPTTRGMLRLNSSGTLMLRIDSSCMLQAGNYEIIARLIP